MFAGKDFLTMQAPPGYKAGIGRGATGFTTRADLPLQRASAAGAPDPDRLIDAEDALLAPGRSLKKDDQEAEKIYTQLNDRLSQRTRKPKQEPSPEPDKDALKLDLAAVSIDEWASLPEAMDFTRRYKRQRKDEDLQKRSYIAPESLFQKGPGYDTELDDGVPAKSQALNARLDLAFNSLKKTEASAPIIADADRTRSQLEAMIKMTPLLPQGYIGLARLESQQQQPKKARAAILRGIEKCPGAAEIWLEAIKLHHGADQLAIAARAVDTVPSSPDVWRLAIQVQPKDADKLQVVHQALTALPENSELWELAIDLESPEDQKEVLEVALELAPSSELYIRGAQISPAYLDAGVAKFPSSRPIWFAKVKLGASVSEAIEATGRDEWLEFAQQCEGNDLETATRVVDALDLTIDDFEALKDHHVLAGLVAQKLPKTKELYAAWASFDPSVLRQAVKAFPNDPELMARYVEQYPEEAAKEFPSDLVFLNAGRHNLDQGNLTEALSVLKLAADPHGQALYVKALRAAGRVQDAKQAVEKALAVSDFADLYIEKAALLGDVEVLAVASQKQPQSEDVWLAWAARLPAVRARAVLISGQSHCPKSSRLWLARLRLERQEQNDVNYLLNKALQECPADGPLWAEKLLLTPRIQRSKMIAQAVKATGKHPAVLVAAGLHQWSLNKPAGNWFDAAVEQDAKYGDAYLWRHRYAGDADAEGAARQARPTGGELWSRLRAEHFGQDIAAVFRAARRLENPFE